MFKLETWMLIVTFSAIGVLFSAIAALYTSITSTPETVSPTIVMIESIGIYGFGTLAGIGMIISSIQMSREENKRVEEIIKLMDSIDQNKQS